jgi:hypothetical protein
MVDAQLMIRRLGISHHSPINLIDAHHLPVNWKIKITRESSNRIKCGHSPDKQCQCQERRAPRLVKSVKSVKTSESAETAETAGEAQRCPRVTSDPDRYIYNWLSPLSLC